MRNWKDYHLEVADEPETASARMYREERERLARERQHDAAYDVVRGVLAEAFHRPVSAHGHPKVHQRTFTSRTLPIDLWNL